MTNQISRRTMLRGAGALLALPFLEAMVPARVLAAGATVQPPKRFAIFTVTGGTVLESWRPRKVGPLAELPSILRPLEFAKQDLTVLTGLVHNGRSENLNGHEHCAYLHLTGVSDGPQGPWQTSGQRLGRSGRGPRGRRADDPAVAGDRPHQSRNAVLLPRSGRAGALRGQSAAGVRAHVPRPQAGGAELAAPPGRRGRGRAEDGPQATPSIAASSIWSSKRPATCAASSAAPTSASSMSTCTASAPSRSGSNPSRPGCARKCWTQPIRGRRKLSFPEPAAGERAHPSLSTIWCTTIRRSTANTSA